MKKMILFLFSAALFGTACNKNAGSANTVLNEMVGAGAVVAPTTTPGMFVSNGPSVSGTVKIYETNGKLSLALENFKTDNGPDLHVYLSQEMFPVNFIDLGKLKATSGNQVYDISGMPDFTKFKFALIHCQQFNHLFGSAQLIK